MRLVRRSGRSAVDARARRITRRWRVDSNGTTIAVVGGGATGSRRAYVSERPAGGSPGAAAPLPLASGEGFRPWAATNDSGGAAIVFDVVDSGNQVYGSLRSASGWSTPVKLNEDGTTAVAQTARVAIGPDGVLHATWIDGTIGKLIFASLPPGGSPDPGNPPGSRRWRDHLRSIGGAEDRRGRSGAHRA